MKITVEIEHEINKRANEKLENILLNIESASKVNHVSAFNLTLVGDLRKGQECFEKHIGFEWLRKLFVKESTMPVPYTSIEKFKEKRNIAVDKIMMIMHPTDRHKVNSIIAIIEECIF